MGAGEIMVEFGYASKYNPVGWKATIPDISDTCDVVAVYGNRVYEFVYATMGDGRLALSLKSGRAKYISSILPQLQDTGSFDGSVAVSNDKTGMAYIRYIVNSVPYDVYLYRPAPMRYYCKELPVSASLPTFPKYIHSTRHMYDNQYLNYIPIFAEGTKEAYSAGVIGNDIVSCLGMVASIDSVSMTYSMTRLDPYNAQNNIPATFIKSCATLGIATTSGIIKYNELPRTLNILSSEPTKGPMWLWWMPTESSDMRARRVEFVVKAEQVGGYTNVQDAWYAATPASETNPNFTVTTIGYLMIKASYSVYIDGVKVDFPDLQSATMMSYASPIGIAAYSNTRPQTQLSLKPWRTVSNYHVSGDLLVVEGYGGLYVSNAHVSYSLAPSTLDWDWSSSSKTWYTSYEDYGAVFPGKLTQPSSFVVINLNSKTIVHEGSGTLIGTEHPMVALPIVDAILQTTTGSALYFNVYGKSSERCITLTDYSSRVFTGVGNNLVCPLIYTEDSVLKTRFVFKTQYGVFISDNIGTKTSGATLSPATQIPFVAEDARGNMVPISIPSSSVLVDLKSEGLFMNRKVIDTTEAATIEILKWY